MESKIRMFGQSCAFGMGQETNILTQGSLGETKYVQNGSAYSKMGIQALIPKTNSTAVTIDVQGCSVVVLTFTDYHKSLTFI